MCLKEIHTKKARGETKSGRNYFQGGYEHAEKITSSKKKSFRIVNLKARKQDGHPVVMCTGGASQQTVTKIAE